MTFKSSRSNIRQGKEESTRASDYTIGNFAKYDSSGNLIDSGVSNSDLDSTYVKKITSNVQFSFDSATQLGITNDNNGFAASWIYLNNSTLSLGFGASSIVASAAAVVVTASGEFGINAPSLRLNTGGINNAFINSSLLNADRTYQLPDASGTIALLSNLGSYLPLAGGIMTGDITFTTATAKRLKGISQGTASLGNIQYNNYIGLSESGSQGTGIKMYSEQVSDNTKNSVFLFGSSGLNISSNYAASVSINIITSSTGVALNYSSPSLSNSVTANNQYAGLTYGGSLGNTTYFRLTGAGAGFATLGTTFFANVKADNIAGSSKTFQFPNNSGTFALISDLSSYLPLVGGIMSGDINTGTATSVKLKGISQGTASLGNIQYNNYIAMSNTGSTGVGMRIYSEKVLNTAHNSTSIFSALSNSQFVTDGTANSNFLINNSQINLQFNNGAGITSFVNLSGVGPFLSFQGNGANTSFQVYSDGIHFNTGLSDGIIKADTVSGNKTYQLPNASGTFALVTTFTASNGLTRSTNDFRLGGTLSANTTILGNSQNLAIGTVGSKINDFTSNISDALIFTIGSGAGQLDIDSTLSALYHTNVSTGISSGLESNDNRSYMNWTDNITYFRTLFTDINGIGLETTGNTFSAYFKTTNITSANRTFEFPNVSGTLALLSDLTTGYVPLAAANDIIMYSSAGGPVAEHILKRTTPVNGSPWNNIRTYNVGGGSYASPANWTQITQDPSNTYILTQTGSNSSQLTVGYTNLTMEIIGGGYVGLTTNTFYSQLKTTNLTADRAFEFPDNNGTLLTDTYNKLSAYLVSGLPSAAEYGLLIYVTDESGGAVPAFSDGTNWRRVTDRVIVS